VPGTGGQLPAGKLMLRFFAKLARKTASFLEQWTEGGIKKVWATTKERLWPTLPKNLSEWLANAKPSAEQLEKFRKQPWPADAPTFTIIVPVYETPADWLTECLNSVKEQTYPHWQCVVVDDASMSNATLNLLKQFTECDRRLVLIRNDLNQGVAASCNTALAQSTGTHLLVLDHDDELMPQALHRFARCIVDHHPDVIYADEAITGTNLGDVLSVRARPAFSPVYYLQHPYFVHPVVFRISVLYEAGGWNTALPACHDIELMHRILALKPKVAHLPEVLYRWRTHGGSLGHAKQKLVMDTMVRIAGGEPHPTQFNVLKHTPPVTTGAKVAIIIPFKNRADLLQNCVRNLERTVPAELVQIVLVNHDSTDPDCLAQLEEMKLRHAVVSATGPFNFSKLNNDAVKAIDADVTHLLFLNNDVFALYPGWLESMLGWSTHSGIVGAMLAYPDGTIQHAGIGLGLLSGADHAYRGQPVWKNLMERSVGENCELICVHEVSAVSAACLLIRRTLFDQLDGFDEQYAVGFNDVDLCLRARAKGETILLDANAVLVHEESQSRGKEDRHPEDTARFLRQYANVLAAGDPYLSPLRDPSPRCDTLIPTYRCPDELSARVFG
jgi:GT2 family glycosyltransferase